MKRKKEGKKSWDDDLESRLWDDLQTPQIDFRLETVQEEYLPVQVIDTNRNLWARIYDSMSGIGERMIDYVKIAPWDSAYAGFLTAIAALDFMTGLPVLGGFMSFFAGLKFIEIHGKHKKYQEIRTHLTAHGFDEEYVSKMRRKNSTRVVRHAAKRAGYLREYDRIVPRTRIEINPINHLKRV